MERFKLFEFQEKGVEFLLAHDRALLADEQGCGKSVQVLEAIRRLGAGKMHVLIVCPASLRLMWQRSAEGWLETAGVQIAESGKTLRYSEQVRVAIVSYNYLQKTQNVLRLKAVKWDVIVCDEMHACKNWKSKTTKGLDALLSGYGGKFWGLTGTPATKSGQDYYSYLRLIGRGMWEGVSLRAFSDTYCERTYNPWSGGFTYKGVRADRRAELRDVFSKIVLRRRKKDVLPQLPPKIVQHLPVSVDADVMAECLELDADHVRNALMNDGALPAHIMKILRSVGLGKVGAACDVIAGSDEPIVVMAIHHDVVEAVCEKFPDAVRVTGLESAAEKQAAVDAFQSGSCNVIVCNVHAGGVGITLTRASRMVFIELPWSPAVMMQAEDRIHRIGAARGCHIVKLVAEGTIDRQVMDVLEYKKQFMKAVMRDI